MTGIALGAEVAEVTAVRATPAGVARVKKMIKVALATFAPRTSLAIGSPPACIAQYGNRRTCYRSQYRTRRVAG